MIWHIFKKDFRLLWPVALVSTGLWLALTCVYARAGLFNEPTSIRTLALYLSIVCEGAAIILTIFVVQQDVVSGVRGDWLSRPIKRSDLLLAKAMFIVLMIELPRLAMSFGLALIQDHDVATAFTSAAIISGASFIAILPFFAVASLTENLTQAMLVAFGLIICVVVAYLFFSLTYGTGLDKSGVSWIRNTAASVVSAGVSVIVLFIQYLRRRTIIASAVFAVGAIVVIAIYGMPNSLLFWAQRHLSSDTHSADVVSLSYDPSWNTPEAMHRSLPAPPVLGIPIRIDSSTEAVIVIDYVDVRLLDVDGNLLNSHRAVPFNRPSESWIRIADGKPHHDLLQEVTLNLADFNRLKNKPVRIELTYGLTRLRASSTSVIPASHAQSKTAALGTCATSPSGKTVGSSDLNCFRSSHTPTCVMIKVEPTSVASGLDIPWCRLNYAPAFLKAGVASLPGEWVASYPTAAAQTPGARLLITGFEPQAHFTRKVATPPMNIADLSERTPN